MHARLPVRIGSTTGPSARWDHAIKGDLIIVGIKPLATASVLPHEIKRLEHRLVLGIGGP